MDQENLSSNNVLEVPRDLVRTDEASESENPVSEAQVDYVCRITA